MKPLKDKDYKIKNNNDKDKKRNNSKKWGKGYNSKQGSKFNKSIVEKNKNKCNLKNLSENLYLRYKPKILLLD